MKKILMLFALSFSLFAAKAQSLIKDDAVDNQSQRMVFQQWDQNKFYPKSRIFKFEPLLLAGLGTV